MSKLLMLFAVTAALAGCSRKSTPVTLPPGLPPGAKLEVYTIAAAKAANTKEAIDPGSGGPLFLQTPPIITTTDVATVERSTSEHETANGARSEQPALTVALTRAGSDKMAAATSTLNGETIAVVINGQVVSTPKIVSPIQGSFQISGDSNDARFTSAVEALTKP